MCVCVCMCVCVYITIHLMHHSHCANSVNFITNRKRLF